MSASKKDCQGKDRADLDLIDVIVMDFIDMLVVLEVPNFVHFVCHTPEVVRRGFFGTIHSRRLLANVHYSFSAAKLEAYTPAAE